jgi:hypothetical protein
MGGRVLLDECAAVLLVVLTVPPAAQPAVEGCVTCQLAAASYMQLLQ